MNVINFGSLNIDHVYRVDDFVQPGETLASIQYQQFVGGKGLNQSLALARAGATVKHAGNIGIDGAILKQTLRADGVDVSQVKVVEGASGHAIIQVNSQGENCILLHGGANQSIAQDVINQVLEQGRPGDILLLQNEINNVPAIINEAAERHFTIVFNPAPMSTDVLSYPLDKINYLIVNQTEARALTLQQEMPDTLANIRSRWTGCKVLLTLGAQGAIYQDQKTSIKVDAVKTEAVDTTAAGDTFIGYFLAELCLGSGIQQCLEMACKAAAYSVQRPGAASSIPYRHQL